jgi:hypothetical protein
VPRRGACPAKGAFRPRALALTNPRRGTAR